VLRDEGEAYGRKLAAAGVPVRSVRYNGTIHDFMLLNPIANTPAVRGAVEQASDYRIGPARGTNPATSAFAWVRRALRRERHGERRAPQGGRVGVCLLTDLHDARALRPRIFFSLAFAFKSLQSSTREGKP
jgi:hypothetical protein